MLFLASRGDTTQQKVCVPYHDNLQPSTARTGRKLCVGWPGNDRNKQQMVQERNTTLLVSNLAGTIKKKLSRVSMYVQCELTINNATDIGK
jgi:hypothetical protein